MILPTANKETSKNCTTATNLASDFKQTSLDSSKAAIANSGVKIGTKKISMKESFMCSCDELYRALTEQNVRH